MSGLFGGSVPPPPKPKPPAPMPDEQSPQVMEARRNEAMAIFARDGSRRSTMLTAPGGGVGRNFDSYDRQKLG